MQDNRKTKKQLLLELQEAKERCSELENSLAQGIIKSREAPLRAILENLPFDLWAVGSDGRYFMQSSISRELWGDIVGKRPEDSVLPKQMTEKWLESNRRALSGEIVQGEVSYQMKGEQRFFYSILAPIIDDESIPGIIGVNIDITDKKRLEQKYLQSQKMEAMGQFAGGIAHDFNNVLTAIIGYQYLLQPQLQEDSKARHYAEQVTALAEKAAGLTQTLLAFSRERSDNSKPVDLNELIRNMSGLLKRLIGEDIELLTVLDEPELPVTAVAVQIEHILMNLATNARDAMPGGGSLLVKTERIEVDEDFIHAHGFGKIGHYAVISVSDTGMGMDEKTKTRIFEPFFTTKEAGKGTGLGLATAYGLIERHEGYIHVYSEPGEGTTFRIYLPINTCCIRINAVSGKADSPPHGTETVLLAEDEDSVRKLIRSILEKYGYRVIEAVDGDQAIEKYLIHETEIDALILDVIMPKRNGKEVYDIISKGAPDMKALFISGYNDEMIEKKGIGDRCHIVTKPLSPAVFLKTLRKVLGNRQDPLNGEQPAPCTVPSGIYEDQGDPVARHSKQG
jgi:PAS domain S-box-containing protein